MRIKKGSTSISSLLFPGLPAVFRVLCVPMLLIGIVGCPDSGVDPPTKPEFTVITEEVVSTEASIKIKHASSDSITVNLNRNGQIIAQNFRMQKEILFNDTLLQPKQNYSYTAYKIENGKTVDSTSPLQITTMDTTSHEFAWETFYFGDPSASTSSLNDVAIVNDTLVYAVGEIYIKDSSGLDEIVYNSLKWNGIEWQPLRILNRDFGGTTGYFPLTTIYPFTFDNIWFCNSADLLCWNGESFISKAFFMVTVPFEGQVVKMWGIEGNTIYSVGRTGSIYFYTDTNWQKLESSTANNIYDVWGIHNPTTNGIEVYCASSDDFNPTNNRLLKITNTTKVDTVAWGTGRSLYTVWTATGKTLYAAGGGLWKNSTGTWKQIDLNSNSAMLRIRGNAANDIFVVGAFGLVKHYNGREWYGYNELLNTLYYTSVSIKDNIVALSGRANNGRPIVTIGKRK